MTWSEFFKYVLFDIGDFKLQVGRLIMTICVALVTLIFLKGLRRVILGGANQISEVDEKRRHSIYLIIKYFIWIISIVLMLEVLGIKVSLLLAGSAALLVAVGFGLQPIFSDIVSGFFLLFEGTIKIGDVIEADGVIGKVHEINLRSSEILTRENVVMIIPNSKFIVEKVINWSHNAESVRFTVDIGVAYESDVEFVISCLQEVMDQNEHIEKSPNSFVRFTNFGDSSLDFQLIFWTKDPFTVENLKSDLRRAIHAKLRKEGISIPFPQRDLHIKTFIQDILPPKGSQ
ncbi:MAG: mechanosensitive ion channel domain-containing protein [Crocinitomicaceae bacterium]